MLLKILIIFILTYLCLFLLTLLLTCLVKYVSIFKKNKDKIEYKQVVKKDRKVNKIYNEVLKIWEIQD